MLHKISDFVKRISVMHDEAQKLHKMKYESPKATQSEIDNQIGNIQAMALGIAKDKSKYHRVESERDRISKTIGSMLR